MAATLAVFPLFDRMGVPADHLPNCGKEQKENSPSIRSRVLEYVRVMLRHLPSLLQIGGPHQMPRCSGCG